MMLNTGRAVAFRFATGYGISPRMRLDLLPNTLAYMAATQGYAVIYERHVRRTWSHVSDMARAYRHAIEHPRIAGVYNVGDPLMSWTKQDLCVAISEAVPGVQWHYAEVGQDEDRRDYAVDYSRMTATGFSCRKDWGFGLRQVADAAHALSWSSPYGNV